MALAIRNTVSNNDPIFASVKPAPGTTSIKQGDLITLDAVTNKFKPASTGNAIYGLSADDYAANSSPNLTDRIKVQNVMNWVIRLPYTGATKTSLTDADMYTKGFNINTVQVLDLDVENSDAVFYVVGYDNVKKTADVIVNFDQTMSIG